METLKILNLSNGFLRNLENVDLSESSVLNRLHTLNISHNRLSRTMVDELSKLKCRVIADDQDFFDMCIE